MPPAPRGHRLALALLVGLALLRGLFWVVASIAPSPIDEMQHFDYVRSLAVGDGIPTVGEDLIAPEVRELAKQSPTFGLRSFPYPADVDDPVWDGASPQYEGVQGPTYYAVVAPFYWVGRPFGIQAAFYAVRVGSLLVGIAAIPVAWFLTRRLLPERPELWLLPPALLTFVNAVTAGPATIGNDIVVLTGTAVAGLALLRALSGRRAGAAAAAGLVAGLVLLGKTTALAIIPVLGLLALPALRRWWDDGEEARRSLRRWVLTYGAAFALPYALWTAWNLWTYRALSGVQAADAITGAGQDEYPRSLETLRMHLTSVRPGLWSAQLVDLLSTYRVVWEVGMVVLVAAGLLVAWRRRDGEARQWISWGAGAYPVTFLAVVAAFFALLGESGLLLGRYLWVAVVPLAIGMGVAAGVVGGRRFGIVLVLALAVVATWYERTNTFRFLEAYYEGDLAGEDLAPVFDQSFHDGYTRPSAVVVDVSCEVEALDLGFEEPPERIQVIGASDGLERSAVLEGATEASFARYRLEEPLRGPLTVPVHGGFAASATEREAQVSFVGAEGDPLARAHCPTDDARARRFDQLFDPVHPPISRDVLRAWPTVGAVISTGCLLACLLLALRRRSREPR